MEMSLDQFFSATNYYKLKEDIEKVFKKFNSYLLNSKNEPYSIFITFQTPQMVSNILKICKRSCITGSTYLEIEDTKY